MRSRSASSRFAAHSLLLLLFALCFLLIPSRSSPAAERAPHPNIVLMVSDDQGLQAGCYGDTVVQTPHLDRLAAEGTRFTHAFCTTASCSPSRSVILTGLYNHANGQYGLQQATHNFGSYASVRGLPVLLHAAGYRTCSIGKVHVQPEGSYHFDVYANKGGQHISQMIANAKYFLEEVKDRPFFLYFCPREPHRMAKGFGNEEARPASRTRYDPTKVEVPKWLPDNPAVRADLADYYEATTRADAALGELIQTLKESGHLDDTVVIYLSDNGPPFPGAKTTLYETGIHLPLVVRNPSAAGHGIACDAMVTWADITPTILDMAGVTSPTRLQGRSLLPILEQEKPVGWDEVHLSHSFHEVTMYYPMRAIRTRRHKLILNIAHELSYPFAQDLYASTTWQSVLSSGIKTLGKRTIEAYEHRPKWELYDLEKDPGEIRNLANDPALAGTLAELQKKLRTWQEETKDPWVIKYEHE